MICLVKDVHSNDITKLLFALAILFSLDIIAVKNYSCHYYAENVNR